MTMIETTTIDDACRRFIQIEDRIALAVYRPEQFITFDSFGAAVEPPKPKDEIAELMKQQRIGLALILALVITVGVGIARMLGAL